MSSFTAASDFPITAAASRALRSSRNLRIMGRRCCGGRRSTSRQRSSTSRRRIAVASTWVAVSGQPGRQRQTHGLVSKMVGQGIACDPIEPAGKWATAVPIPADAPQRLGEDLGRYVLGRCGVTKTCTCEPVDTFDMAVIEDSEGFGIRPRPLDEKALILVHARSLWRNRGSVITEFTDGEEE